MDTRAATNDPNLLEREAEVDALDRALAGAVEGRGSVLAIEGPPGIGKSSLVGTCQALAAKREMYAISVRATELERSYPYGIVRQTADSVALDKPDDERAALSRGPPSSPSRSWSRGRLTRATAPSSCTSGSTGCTG